MRTSLAAVEAAQEIGHANSLAYALAYGACPIAMLRGEWERAERLVETLLDHAQDNRLGLWHAHALAYRGEVLAERSEFVAAIMDFRAALLGFKKAVSGPRLPAHCGAFARALVHAGQLHEALAVAEEAIVLTERREERWCLPELLQIKGEILEACGSVDQAEAVLLTAVGVSRQHAMPGWELRASVCLGKLWRGLGRDAEAFDLVSTALAPFTEGETTADILEARRYLGVYTRTPENSVEALWRRHGDFSLSRSH